MNETLAHQSTVLYKRLSTNIRSTSDQVQYECNNVLTQIQLRMYSTTGQQQLGYRVTPVYHGNCHLECLTGNAWGPSWTRPLIICMRPEVDVRMRWECMVRYGATPRNPRIPTHAQTTKVGGVASPWGDAWGILLKTGSKRDWNYALENDYTYEHV